VGGWSAIGKSGAAAAIEYLKPWESRRFGLVSGNSWEMEMREGPTLSALGCPLLTAETSALAALLNWWSHWHPSSYHACSTARSVKLIQDATRGLPITVSTSWMHLLDTKSS